LYVRQIGNFIHKEIKMERSIRFEVTVLVVLCLMASSARLYAATDTTIKGTTSNSTNVSLEVTNSSNTTLLSVRNDGVVSLPDSGLLDLSAINASSATEGLKLPQANGITSATAEGQLSWDSTKDYAAIGNGTQQSVLASQIFAINGADLTGTNGTGSQPIFNTAYDTLTVPANTTYYFELFLSVTNGTTTCTKALDFDDGTATFTAIRYSAVGQNVAVNTTGTAQSSTHVDTAASTVVLATGTTSWWIRATGIIRFNAGGTFIPKFAFSAAPGTTVLIKRESYLLMVPLGSDTVTSAGPWA
jgi:hypothetical protein